MRPDNEFVACKQGPKGIPNFIPLSTLQKPDPRQWQQLSGDNVDIQNADTLNATFLVSEDFGPTEFRLTIISNESDLVIDVTVPIIYLSTVIDNSGILH